MGDRLGFQSIKKQTPYSHNPQASNPYLAGIDDAQTLSLYRNLREKVGLSINEERKQEIYHEIHLKLKLLFCINEGEREIVQPKLKLQRKLLKK